MRFYIQSILFVILLVAVQPLQLSAQPGAVAKDTITCVTYFHGTIRCQACITIEQFARLTMETTFGKQLREGSMLWRVEDYEKENDSLSVEKYGLENQALIVSRLVRGNVVAWKNLPKIWEFVGDYDKFREYVSASVRNWQDAD
jgi:hypothetical protein